MTRDSLCRLALPLLAMAALGGCEQPAPRLTVTDVRAVSTGEMAAVYMTIGNSGGADRLVKAEAAEVGDASLHVTSNEQGVVRMRPATDGMAIPAGEGLILAPQGNHIMLMATKPLKPDDRFALRLTFERHRPLALSVPVEAPVEDK